MADTKVTCKLRSPSGNEIVIEGDASDKAFQDLCKAKDENRSVYLSGYNYPWSVYYYNLPYRWYYTYPYYTYGSSYPFYPYYNNMYYNYANYFRYRR